MLPDADILDLWDRGTRRHPIDRALLTLGMAGPEAASQSPADWPLGRRNQALAQLRGDCFGHAIHGWTPCPRCGQRLEFETDWRALAEQAGEADADTPITVGGRVFRLPTSRDLARVAHEADPIEAAMRLLEDCRISADGPVAWSEQEFDKVSERMALADPLAETRLRLACPSCAHVWEASFDIAAFLWEEIEARAKRTLFEVHTLALAYGWSEAQILSLSASRRALYVEMVGS
jgi:hypothetical protein